MYKVLICGARDWDDGDAIAEVIDALVDEHGSTKLLIIAGGAPGADTVARVLAHERDVHVAEVHALWATRHRGAGPQRNEAMLALDPDEVIAFHHAILQSKGTKHMVKAATDAGLNVRIVS